jgi:hypothetical protein
MRNHLRFAVLAAVAVLAAAPAAQPADSRILPRDDRPAHFGEEALPVGNGRTGAMVQGGARLEHVQQNEDPRWSGAPTPRLADPTFRELAHEPLCRQLERTPFPNLLGAHPRLGGTTPCFQIDGNFATAAAIAEIRLQSHGEEIALLPALPPAWAQGSGADLRARGGFLVGRNWHGAALAAAPVPPRQSGSRAVRARTPLPIGSEPSRAVGPEPMLTFSTTAVQIYCITAVR